MYVLAIAVGLEQLRIGRRSDNGHALARDAAVGRGDSSRAGHQVGGGIASLEGDGFNMAVGFAQGLQCRALAHAQTTYRGDNTSLEVAALEARQKKSSSVGSDGSCASEESDSVETHGDFVSEMVMGPISITSVIGEKSVCTRLAETATGKKSDLIYKDLNEGLRI